MSTIITGFEDENGSDDSCYDKSTDEEEEEEEEEEAEEEHPDHDVAVTSEREEEEDEYDPVVNIDYYDDKGKIAFCCQNCM